MKSISPATDSGLGGDGKKAKAKNGDPGKQVLKGQKFMSMDRGWLYRDDPPDPQDIGTFEWQTILAFMGASEAEIADVQKRMGRVRR